jgi:hypothetical protein
MESNIILSFDDYKDQEFELDTSNCTYCGKLCINPFLKKKGKRKRYQVLLSLRGWLAMLIKYEVVCTFTFGVYLV